MRQILYKGERKKRERRRINGRKKTDKSEEGDERARKNMGHLV
jgi:hypothetical protein